MEGRRHVEGNVVSEPEEMTDNDLRLQLAIRESLAEGRNMALNAAIEVAKQFCGGGHSPECVVRALEDLKAMMDDVRPAPSKQN